MKSDRAPENKYWVEIPYLSAFFESRKALAGSEDNHVVGSSIESLKSIWPDVIYPRFFSKSRIHLLKQLQIVDTLEKITPALKEQRLNLDRIVDVPFRGNAVSPRPSWYSLNTTNSKAGYRFQFGLNNQGCSYLKHSGLGCLNCGYFAGLNEIGVPDSTNLTKQIDKAFKWARRSQIPFDVVEINGDGSFFCDEEVPPDTRQFFYSKIAENGTISKLHVESRPEYINPERVRLAIGTLREDQELEIAIGLESADDFIREICIQKNIDMCMLRERLEIVKELGKRCSV
jgi:uncharacterized Fe-S cluster-containing MiaB family protein